MAVGCLLWLDRRDHWEHAWLYFSLPVLFGGWIAWDLWTHKWQTMNVSKEFKEELLSGGLLVFSIAWLLLGLVSYTRDGSWAYLTLPLFAVAAAWLRARKRQRRQLNAAATLLAALWIRHQWPSLNGQLSPPA